MKIRKIAAMLMATTIIGCAATAMSASAAAYKMKVMKGDVNGDGRIDITDQIIVNNYVIGVKPISKVYKDAADVNWDGEVDIIDVIYIRDHINGRRAIKSGNVLGRNYVSTDDANAIMDHITGKKPLKGAALTRADINSDGYVNIIDYNMLTNYLNK